MERPVISSEENSRLQEKQRWSLRVIALSVLLTSLGLGICLSSWFFVLSVGAFLVPVLGKVPVGLEALPLEEQHRALDQESANQDQAIKAIEGGDDLLTKFAALEASLEEKERKEARVLREEQQKAVLPPSQGQIVTWERPLREKIKSIHLDGSMWVTISCWTGLEPKLEISAKEMYQGLVSVDIVDGVLTVRCDIAGGNWEEASTKPVHVVIGLGALHRVTVAGRVVAEITREKMSNFALHTSGFGKATLKGEGRNLVVVHNGRSADVSNYARTELVQTGSTVGLIT
jgi:hypothetical protein